MVRAQQRKRDLNFCKNLTPYLRALLDTRGGDIKSDLLSRSGCEYASFTMPECTLAPGIGLKHAYTQLGENHGDKWHIYILELSSENHDIRES